MSSPPSSALPSSTRPSAAVDVVRAVVESYRALDKSACAALLADGFTFTSPQDDHIDKAAFLDRCFPTGDSPAPTEIIHLVQVPGSDDVLLCYRYDGTDGLPHRNAELLTVRGGLVHETQVFFGGVVP